MSVGGAKLPRHITSLHRDRRTFPTYFSWLNANVVFDTLLSSSVSAVNKASVTANKSSIFYFIFVYLRLHQIVKYY